MNNKYSKLNLFYEEPDPDRWIRYDRYPRRIIRRIIRGSEPIGGVKRWFLNLCSGLDKLQIPYSVNDYAFLKKNPAEWALVVGKPQVIAKIPAKNPILYGPALPSHPSENNFAWFSPNIKHLLISSEWFKLMYDQDLPVKLNTSIWPSGIDTELWKPLNIRKRHNRILIYDKVRWNREHYKPELIDKIRQTLIKRNISVEYLQYGYYKEKEYLEKLDEVDAMIFLCEHETQGFAYLQALSKDVPILAWDRAGYWLDPEFYPEKVKYRPVTSVPYWSENCGLKFEDMREFQMVLPQFLHRKDANLFNPREYILENLTLEKCAMEYYNVYQSLLKAQ
jgi:hypothetical protein